jgi:hypothetical protein
VNASSGGALSYAYFTVSTALPLMSPAVVAVTVVLPTARPVATLRSVIVAFEGSLHVQTTPGVLTTVTGQGFEIAFLLRLPSSPWVSDPQHLIAPPEAVVPVYDCEQTLRKTTSTLTLLAETD